MPAQCCVKGPDTRGPYRRLRAGSDVRRIISAASVNYKLDDSSARYRIINSAAISSMPSHKFWMRTFSLNVCWLLS